MVLHKGTSGIPLVEFKFYYTESDNLKFISLDVVNDDHTGTLGYLDGLTSLTLPAGTGPAGYTHGWKFTQDLSTHTAVVEEMGTLVFAIYDTTQSVTTFPFRIDYTTPENTTVTVDWTPTPTTHTVPNMYLHMDASHHTTTGDPVTYAITNVQELVTNTPFLVTGDQTPTITNNYGIHTNGGHLYTNFGSYNTKVLSETGSHLRTSIIYVGQKVNGANPNWAAYFQWSGYIGSGGAVVGQAPFVTSLALHEYGSYPNVGTTFMRYYYLESPGNRWYWSDTDTDLYILHATVEYDHATTTTRQTLKVYDSSGSLVFPAASDAPGMGETEHVADITVPDNSFYTDTQTLLHIGGYSPTAHSGGTATMEVKFYKDILSAEQEVAEVAMLAAKWATLVSP